MSETSKLPVIKLDHLLKVMYVSGGASALSIVVLATLGVFLEIGVLVIAAFCLGFISAGGLAFLTFKRLNSIKCPDCSNPLTLWWERSNGSSTACFECKKCGSRYKSNFTHFG